MADFETLPAGSRRAMELALEALEFMSDQWGFTNKANRPERWQAIEALRAALAEAEEGHQPGCALLKIPSRDCDCRPEPSITTEDERVCLTCAHILKGMLDAPCVGCSKASHWERAATMTAGSALSQWFGGHRAVGSK